jgi:hypothetical protein
MYVLTKFIPYGISPFSASQELSMVRQSVPNMLLYFLKGFLINRRIEAELIQSRETAALPANNLKSAIKRNAIISVKSVVRA